MTGGGEFGLLDAGDPGGRRAWMALWERWPGREVFAHPDFVRLFCAEGDRALCAVWDGSGGGVLLPLVARPLSRERWGGRLDSAFDLISPYGYGGPFRWGTPDGPAFWAAFDGWARRAGAVSCFLRLSLFEEQTLAPPEGVEAIAPNIVRALDLSPEALWMDYDHKVRKNVKRARESGVTFAVDLWGDRLGEFLRIYHATMDRREAAEGYFFGEDFFRTMLRRLPGQALFFHALSGDAVVSTELVLVSPQHTYSFLGGTLEEAFPLRPNDLLKHEIISWTARTGRKAFVLGGGYQGEDGIFRYKRAFAPDGARPFRAAKLLFDGELYARALSERRRCEAERGLAWEPRPGYFPAYRG